MAEILGGRKPKQLENLGGEESSVSEEACELDMKTCHKKLGICLWS